MTAPLAGPAPRHARTVLLMSALGITVGALVGIALPAGLGWDFANFYDTGGRVLHGQMTDLYDPTTPVGGRQPQGELGFWGTPISAVLYAPLALLPPYAASVTLKTLNTLATIAGVLILFQWLRRRVDPDPTEQWTFAAIVAGLALLFQPFWTVYRVGGQTTPFIFLMLVLAFVCFARGKMTHASVFLIAVAALKPAFVLIPASLFVVAGRSFATRFVVFGLASVALSVLVLGWAIHAEFLEVMLSGLGGSVIWRFNSSLYVVFENLRWLPEYGGSPEALEPAMGIAITGLKVITLATVGALWWRGRSEGLGATERREVDFVLAVLVFLFVSEVLWEHYLVPLFLLICHVWATRRSFSRGALILVGSVSAVSLCQNLILIEWIRVRVVMDTVLEAVALGLLKSAPLWLTLAFVWAYGGQFVSSFRSRAEIAT